MKYYLAVDIGASSGRHILAHLEDGKIVLEEMYRFTNGNVTRDGHLCWELDRLFEEIVNGIAACAKAGKAPSSMGIDTAAAARRILPDAQIVFATAYSQYGVKAFELGVNNYILKPFDPDRVRRVLEKCCPGYFRCIRR